MSLEIKNLHVSVDGKEILKGINLKIEKGETIALMGPNGSGKSTLANVLMGNPKYEITKGNIIIENQDINELSPNERAKKGLFMSFQQPLEIPGVTISNFLRTAYNSLYEKNKISVVDFHKMIKQKMGELNIDPEFSRRYLNQGFSGGEKKKAEILQMSILNPKYILLDETDSGLDVDALRIISKGIQKIKNKKNCFLIITHYKKILEYITPDKVIILKDGLIVKTGDKTLAEEIDEKGFENE